MALIRNSLRALLQLLVPPASTLLLGFRYITSRWIAWLSVLGFAVGILVLIVVTSVMNGFMNELRSSIRGSLSDLIIRPVMKPGQPLPPSLGAVRAAIAAVPGVDPEAIAPRITWPAMVSGMYANERRLARDGSHVWEMVESVDAGTFLERDTVACQLVGIDFEADRRATNFGDSIQDFGVRETRHVVDIPVPDPTDPFHTRTAPDPALLPAERIRLEGDGVRTSSPGVFGAFLARRLGRTAHNASMRSGFYRGCEIRLLTFGPDAIESGGAGGGMEPSFRNVAMMGTFRTGTYDIDIHKIFLDRRDLARNILGIEKGWDDYYTEIVVRTSVPEEQVSAVAWEVQRKLESSLGRRFLVQTWEDEKQNHLAAIDYEKKMMFFILFFIILVAGINMFTTLWMLVTEKTRDVGIISALGISRIGVLQLFLTMGVFISLIGELLGFVGGMLIVENIGSIEAFLFNAFGFQMFNPEIYIFDHLPADPDPLWIFYILAATFVASILFSLAPAIRAARKDPVEALRYE